jgi:hypothetical protein
MSKFMMIAGLLIAAAGAALWVLMWFSPGQLDSRFITPDAAATLFVGGVLALGLGGVIDALGASGRTMAAPHIAAAAPAAAAAAIATAAESVKEAATETAATLDTAAKATTADAVAALEKAKTDIAQALGPDAKEEEAKAEVLEPEPAAAEDAADDEQLYVVEERTIRSHPARVLSDGTVEAETDEGWMRFENMEHLEEYLDAMEPTASA